jgi:hypothetical protein
MTQKLKVAALAAGALAFVAMSGAAQAQSLNKCQGTKIKDAGKKAACLAGLQAKVAAKGGTVDPAKVAKCQAKVGAAYTKLEGKGDCNTTGDAGAIEAKVDAFVDDLVTELATGTLPNKCQGSKIKDAGKKAACLAGLQAKFASSGTAIDPAKVAKCQAKVGAAYTKLEGKGDCNTTGDAGAIEAKVDAFVDDLVNELDVGASPSCCSAAEIVTVSSAGTLEVSTLPAFPFPANVTTTIDVGAADADCKHTGTVPQFNVPVFCIPALQFTSAVYPTGCAAGSDLGTAVVWDAASSNPQPDVIRVGDTSDPDSNSCGTLGTGCTTAAGAAGGDTAGNIDTTRSGNANGVTGAVHTQVDIPVHSITWVAADASCPDGDATFNAGTDTPVTDFFFILSPTTGHTSATYTDLNADGCKRAGNGPDSKVADGTPATGPCCTVGQATTVSATGIAFTGGAPLYDITFKSITPTTISACNASSVGTCTLTNDACQD